MDMEMYRSILLADVVGKISTRAHRFATLGVLAQDFSSERTRQCGGVPGLGTEFRVLAIRLLQEKAQMERTSIALIFVDARQAFYAIIRKLVLNVVEKDQAVISFGLRVKIPPTAMEELKIILGKGPAMDDSTLSDLIVRDIASTFTAHVFEVRGSAKFWAAHKGTRPGHPYADVVLSFASPQVLKAFALVLDSEDLRPGVPAAAFHEG